MPFCLSRHRWSTASTMFFYLLLFLSVQATALPLHARQAAAQPSSVTTVQTINSASGPVIQTCTITLTPIKDDQGNDAVREVKTCTVSVAVPNSVVSDTTSASQTSPPVSSSSVATASQTASPISSTSVATAVTSSSASSVSSSAVTSSSVPTSSASVSISASSVTTSASSVTTSLTPSSTSVGVKSTSSISAPTSIGISQSKPSTVAPALATSTRSTSGSAAAAEQATNTAFTLPGKKLSVLPIGLGVFAGISVIALIVVGLVTYERTKYRKAFRQRRLAESGAEMGYGGSVA